MMRHVSMLAGTFCIKPSETETLLGGHVHQTLQWNQHISDHKCSLIRQLTGRVNGLKQIARTATFSTRLMIANGAIMSKLVYLITVWGGASQYLLKAVQVKQLDAARTVYGFNSMEQKDTAEEGCVDVSTAIGSLPHCIQTLKQLLLVCVSPSMLLFLLTTLIKQEMQQLEILGSMRPSPPPIPSSIGP